MPVKPHFCFKDIGDPIFERAYRERAYDWTPDLVVVRAQQWWADGRHLASNYEKHLIEMYIREARLSGGQLVDLALDDFITPAQAYARMYPEALAVMYEDGQLSKDIWQGAPACAQCGSQDMTATGMCRDCKKRRIAKHMTKPERAA